MKLEDFITYEQPTNYIVHSDQYIKDGRIPVLTAGQSFILGYTDEEDGIYNGEPVVLFDDFTTAVQYVDFPFKVKSSAMKILKNKANANIKFCYYLLSWLQKMPANHKRQWISTISQIDIKLPSLAEQEEIVKKIEAVSNIIKHRNEELAKLDDLIKARFVEMFGDCDNRMAMNELCSIITDGTHQPPKFQDNGIPFIFVSNLAENKITYDTEKFISDETYGDLIRRTPVEKGDVLLSTVGSYGHAAVVTEDNKFLFQRHIAYLKPKKELINGMYLQRALLAPEAQRQIEEKVKGIAQKTLNLSEIRKIIIPLPSDEEQKRFIGFCNQVNKSKASVQKSLDETQLLFDSLMQKYFG